MRRILRASLITLAAAWLAAPLPAADVQLAAVQFPERSTVKLEMAPTARVTPAQARASVKVRDGQANIEVDYENLPPAILFGGDVTSYVLWAVARDGTAENLGELTVRSPNGSGSFRSGQKEFALLVTAEAFPLVVRPSDLVVLTSLAPKSKKFRSATVTLSNLTPGVRVGNQNIGGMSYKGTEPIVVVQAQSVLTQAKQMGADQYDANALREAETTLAQSTNSFRAGREKVGVDYAARSLSLSSSAIRDTQRRVAEQAAADAAAQRAAQMRTLEEQRTSAQQQAAAAQEQALSAREQAVAAREQAAAAQAQLASSQQELAQAQQQAATAQQQMTTLQQQAQLAQEESAAAQARADAAGLSAEAAQAARLEAEQSRSKAEALASQADAARSEAERASAAAAEAAATLEAQKRELQAENQRLVAERADLEKRLTGALSDVADISQSARGIVVSLPDILFDLNKATLKPNAQVALGKLSGIVSLFPAINLRIEGHTDSTGTDAINDKLSRDRADSVMAFLRGQGVASSRMTTEGYGSRVPVADNSTPPGRARNRRVEIILAEGEIQGAGR
jgi:outer membrane protein OmpA-like peptidoglycan-associated protein